jgi:hypothetical protein
MIETKEDGMKYYRKNERGRAYSRSEAINYLNVTAAELATSPEWDAMHVGTAIEIVGQVAASRSSKDLAWAVIEAAADSDSRAAAAMKRAGR